jgi:hypothetical protein
MALILHLDDRGELAVGWPSRSGLRRTPLGSAGLPSRLCWRKRPAVRSGDGTRIHDYVVVLAGPHSILNPSGPPRQRLFVCAGRQYSQGAKRNHRSDNQHEHWRESSGSKPHVGTVLPVTRIASVAPLAAHATRTHGPIWFQYSSCHPRYTRASCVSCR